MNKWLSRIWEAPQKALAHIIKWFISAEELPLSYVRQETVHFYLWDQMGGMSLSNHIFLPRHMFEKLNGSDYQFNYIHHEYGHTIQSHMLGPLYLLVIGLPSIVWAGCFKNWRKKHNKDYYSFYTERWADKLTGVKRGE